MTKKLTAQELLDFLIELKENNIDLTKVEVDFKDSFGDYESALFVEEGLHDSATNYILTSINISSYVENENVEYE